MSDTLLEWHGYRYFPYERDFARLEVASLLKAQATEETHGLRIRKKRLQVDEADRLTYFARVIDSDGGVHIPRQVRLESSARTVERERQATRYSAHGLHEYKGKFNPQIVRAIGNIIGLGPSAWVLDPFCGSGTTLLECAHIGWNAMGVDRNPLAPHVANAKLHAIKMASEKLTTFAEEVVYSLLPASSELSSSKELPESKIASTLGKQWDADLRDIEYLTSWFPRSVLAQIVAVRRVLGSTLPDAMSRAVFEVLLSDQLRDVSFQEPLDLRVRRRTQAKPNYPLINSFIEAVQERVPRITRARAAIGDIRGQHRAHQADIRITNPLLLAGSPPGGFDAVITSPPYANALPYIDTQRLSLVLLGLISSKDIRNTERALIGARELSGSERRTLDAQIVSRTGDVPPAVFSLCQKMLRAAALPGNGFRRQNTPALLLRYCCDMTSFFRTIKPAMKPGAPVALVVGQNRTTLGGQEFSIDTPRLLIEVANHCGYRFMRAETMDTYPRYDLHQRNAINAETLIVVEA